MLEVGVIRPDVHEVGYIFPALSYGIALEELADLVEEHDRDALTVLTEHDGSDCRDCHQEILIKDLAVLYPEHGLFDYVIPYSNIWDQEEHDKSRRRKIHVHYLFRYQI